MRPRKELGKKNRVGATITKLRKENGWKQHELLAMVQVRGIDIGRSALSDIEGQTRQVKYEELKVFAEIFGVTIDDLFEKDSEC